MFKQREWSDIILLLFFLFPAINKTFIYLFSFFFFPPSQKETQKHKNIKHKLKKVSLNILPFLLDVWSENIILFLSYQQNETRRNLNKRKNGKKKHWLGYFFYAFQFFLLMSCLISHKECN